MSGTAASTAASTAWTNADALVKQRYQEKENSDRQRYERELKAWESSQPKAEKVDVLPGEPPCTLPEQPLPLGRAAWNC